jgi:hypothetical protein
VSRLRARLSFANVVSLIALFVALGGVAVASNVFVSSTGVIKGCVAANGTLRIVKPGHACPSGSKVLPFNQRGAAGRPGPDGTTHGYLGVANGPVDITADVLEQQINLQTIGQLSLPAGTFAITAKAGYKVIGPAGTSTEVGFDCRLRDSIEGPRDFATVGGWLGAPNSVSKGSFDGTVSLAGDVSNTAPATEIVECGDTNGASGVDYTIDNLVIQAVQLDKLN